MLHTVVGRQNCNEKAVSVSLTGFPTSLSLCCRCFLCFIMREKVNERKKMINPEMVHGFHFILFAPQVPDYPPSVSLPLPLATTTTNIVPAVQHRSGQNKVLSAEKSRALTVPLLGLELARLELCILRQLPENSTCLISSLPVHRPSFSYLLSA